MPLSGAPCADPAWSVHQPGRGLRAGVRLALPPAVFTAPTATAGEGPPSAFWGLAKLSLN